MRERSSPGIRKSIGQSTDRGQTNEPYGDFDNIYKSVERIGGIGSAKSVLNLQANRERTPSACSLGGRMDSQTSDRRKVFEGKLTRIKP